MTATDLDLAMIDPDVPPAPPDKRPPEGELGTTLTYSESLFADYLDPTSGSISWWEAKEFRDMLRTESQARKVEQVLTLPILSAPTKFTGRKGDKGECEWVTDVLTKPANNGGMSTPLGMVIAQMTTAVTYRVASFEKCWETKDGDFVYDKLAFRPAVNTRVMRDRRSGAYRGLRQDPPFGETDPIPIDARRAFTYTHGVHRSPILGSSDMEIPLVCWRAKQKLRFLWFLFLELHALPKVTTQDTREAGGDDTATKSAAKKIAQMKGGGVIGLPTGVEAKVLETDGHAADLFKMALEYLDSEMTGQVMAQFADLAAAANNGVGSFAMSRDQSDFYMMARRYVASEMSEQFESFVVADLVKWKYGPTGVVPKFEIGPLVTPDIGSLSTLLAAAAPQGQGIPPEFVSFIIEQTAAALGMSPDRVAELVKATVAEQQRAAQSARQAQLAQVTGPIAAASKLVARAGVKPEQRIPAARKALTGAPVPA